MTPKAPTAWPNVSELPEWKPDFPIYEKVPLDSILPKLETLGIELLGRLVEYPPERRLAAADALKHPYFAR